MRYSTAPLTLARRMAWQNIAEYSSDPLGVDVLAQPRSKDATFADEAKAKDATLAFIIFLQTKY
jgi:hypothetical protein